MGNAPIIGSGSPLVSSLLNPVGTKCLSDAIKSEPFPEKFKEPSKATNYDPSMDPEIWLSSYEMAMSIRNATANLCAGYMYLMMSEGAANLWFNGLPEKFINS